MILQEGVTQLLIDWSAGDESALEKLTPLVYDELRRRARFYLKNERAEHTLQATALVHEAYVEILDLHKIKWQNRAHFINTMALLMRRILVDHARKRQSAKRDGGMAVSLSSAERIAVKNDLNLVDLDEVLNRFAKDYPRQQTVVELRFFGGLNAEE
ncbi:MAG: ECF-type sigma factor, partial [Actinomycetota bacterium]